MSTNRCGAARSLPGLRITVEPARSAVAARLEPWFAGTWVSMYGPSESSPAEPPLLDRWLYGWPVGDRHAVVALDGVPIGIAAFRVDGNRLTIGALATAPAYRDRGFGSEAVYALEQISGAAVAMALVPSSNGLAIYFWLRVGYRPLFRSQHEHDGCTVMVRDVAAGVDDPKASGAGR